MRSIKDLLSSLLLRNIAAVAGGTAMGQAVVFAFSPLITRIYSPEVFGIQGVFLSLISILSPAIALRYPMAIVVARNETDVQSLSRLSVLVALTLSCLLGLVLLRFRVPIALAVGGEALGRLIYFLPLALFCIALQDVMDFRAARLGAFRLIAVVTVVQAFLTNAARVLGGLAAPVAMTLVTVTSLAPAVQALLEGWGTRRRLPPPPPLERDDALTLLKTHRDFPLYRMPTDVLNAASQSVPVILLASLFSPAAAGLYTLTRSVLNLPVNIIGSAIGNVLYVRFAELARERKAVAPLLMRVTLFLLLPAPAIVGIAYFAPAVFAFLFGEEWREAGRYAQWMSLWVAIALANIPAVRVAPVIGRQNLLLIANVLMLVVRILSIVIGAAFYGDAWSSVVLFSIVSAISNGGLILMLVLPTLRFDRQNRAGADLSV